MAVDMVICSPDTCLRLALLAAALILAIAASVGVVLGRRIVRRAKARAALFVRAAESRAREVLAAAERTEHALDRVSSLAPALVEVPREPGTEGDEPAADRDRDTRPDGYPRRP